MIAALGAGTVHGTIGRGLWVRDSDRRQSSGVGS